MSTADVWHSRKASVKCNSLVIIEILKEEYEIWHEPRKLDKKLRGFIMFKKLKKHDFNDLLKYMHMLEKGYGMSYIHRTYGISETRLSVLWDNYKRFGESSLKRKKTNRNVPVDIKLQAILDYEEKGLSSLAVQSKYDISASALYAWRKIYHTGGIKALSIDRKDKPPTIMGRPKKKTLEQMTELERLQKENQELKTENALLKKVKALVEERNARLRAIGRKPSKN